MPTSNSILWFRQVNKEDIALVGGKGANLGEITQAGFPVPDGFIITSTAYFNFLRENNLTTKINHLLRTVNFDKSESLLQVASHIQKLIKSSEISEDLVKEIIRNYRILSGPLKDALVAVRSSATAEDLPGASFAGQQETYLNVIGETSLILKVKEAWASLFEPRAIFYRHEQKFDHFRVGIAIVVQKMIESEKSGVMFTIDPVTNEKSKIVIEAIYGLGELIVQGAVTPDHYEVDKNEMKIITKRIAHQGTMLVRTKETNKEVKINKKDSYKQKITDNQILDLALLGKKLERHYYFPQDIEWAIEKDKIYIVQTRPITTIDTSKKKNLNSEKSITLPLILQGAPASFGIASGPVRIINSIHDIPKIQMGEILVASQTNPDYVPAMKKAVAIITDKGGRTSHAAIVSRELGIPAVVGTEKATSILKTGMVVTVNGEKGEVYRGGIVKSFIQNQSSTVVPSNKITTVTKIYVNLSQPDFAEKVAVKNVDGIGLLRAEFIMANIGIHPKKLIHDHKKDLFVNTMANALEKFCIAFNPRPVIYRASDFKTNEYRGLVGGKDYEPIEPNPMLGYRGAFRYISDPKVFELELEAIKYVREKKGLKNLSLMIPFVRTVNELLQVKKILSKNGLHRSPTFKLWMMVEIPANVILLDKFIAAGIDGVSIGSNDLTMLILGTDRDNSEVASIYDEQNEAILWALEKVIKTCNRYKITSSICGQAPSLYPLLVEKLVQWGITSISVSEDAIDSVRKTVAEAEKKLFEK
ncbi:MAG: phosphoenolpyruvate synthase [Patescibacteria group bacterium]|nr:MAG: phosphoenolpyruvate synthase [Patescibacteria group bacterium]